MSVDFKLIGKRIQQRRLKIKKTQENLAEYLDMSVGYVSLVERGKTKISLSTLARVADFLNCNISDLADNSSTESENYMNDEISSIICKFTAAEKKMLLRLINTYINNR